MDTFNLRKFLKENRVKEDITGYEDLDHPSKPGWAKGEREYESEEALDVMEKIDNIQNILAGESSDHVKLYLKSVIRDIQRGDLSIMRYNDDDVYEDFSNYIADKMSG